MTTDAIDTLAHAANYCYDHAWELRFAGQHEAADSYQQAESIISAAIVSVIDARYEFNQ